MRIIETLDEADIAVRDENQNESKDLVVDFIHSSGGTVGQYIVQVLYYFIMISLTVVILNFFISTVILNILVLISPFFNIFTGWFPPGTKQPFLLGLITLITIIACIIPATSRNQTLIIISGNKIMKLENRRVSMPGYNVSKEMEIDDVNEIQKKQDWVEIKGDEDFTLKSVDALELQNKIYKIR